MPPGFLDLLLAFVLVVVTPVVEHYRFWPRFRAAIASGKPDARVSGYQRGIVGQWLFTAAVFALWIAYARPFSALRLEPSSTGQLWLGVGFVALTVVLGLLQLASAWKLSAEQRVAVRPTLGAVAFLLPHTAREHRWFLALSFNAGFCEELLYRGYLTWCLSPWLGAPLAMLAVVIAFGLGHSYQGTRYALRATIAGAVMAGVVLATNWLVPAMIIHALVDASSGTTGFLLLRESQQARTT